jgi:exopolysaccharide biosynthesis protein
MLEKYSAANGGARDRLEAGRSKKSADNQKLLLLIVRFLLLNIAFFALTAPFVVWLGPLPNTKNTVLGAVATSQHHYLLRYIGLSPWEISQLLPPEPQTGGSVYGVSIDESHSDEVTLTQIKSSRFKGYLLEVRDPTRVRLGVTVSLGVRGQTVSDIARDNGAVAAINAGGFIDPSGTGNGRTPFGIVIHNGFFLNGADTQDKAQLIGLDEEGLLVTGYYTVREIRQMRIRDGVSFGPTLIRNGEKQITEGDGGWGIAPRTAIGQKQDGAILLLTVDGRQTDSIGATLLDVQNILHDNGAWTAANLDGGSSTTMYYNGKVINNPCDLMGERLVPTAIIVI